MSIRLKAECPMCKFTHLIKLNDGLTPDFSDVEDIRSPALFLMSVTSDGDRKIKNHLEPIEKFHGGNGNSEQIEKAVLEHMLSRSEDVTAAIESRLSEL